MKISKTKILFIYILTILASLTQVSASEDKEVQTFLQNFHQNPFFMMNQLPQQVVNGRVISRGSIRLAKASRSFDAELDLNFHPLSIPVALDLATSLVDQGLVNTSIESLETLGLTKAAIVQIPWADSYWPVYKGLIGDRYGDPKFPNARNFELNYNYVVANPATSILATNDPALIDQLSPAEKYDLLLGDPLWTLTTYSWNAGKRFLEIERNVPSWIGICHGWAGAAHMNEPVTHKPLVAVSANNIPITFYPSDVKALYSMLWANASPPTRFVGTKCRINNPERNANGRIIEPSCLDTNPATFHLILTNQLGLNHRSFVFDATFDAEVWNYPLVGYSFTYFNPQTLVSSAIYKAAVIPIEQFSIDKFKEFRSPQVRYVVGVAMDDTYVIEINPNHGPQLVSPQKTIRHIYDLELNDKFEIIGGEWYSNAHPDFIWTFDPNAEARSSAELALSPPQWNLQENIPASWIPVAQKASAAGQPMLAVIKALLAREVK